MAASASDITQACLNGETNIISQCLSNLSTIPDTTTIQNLLIAAASKAQTETVTLLFARFPSIAITEELIRTSIRTGSTTLFSVLLEQDSSISKTSFDRSNPLSIAITRRQTLEFINLLLSTGADPNDPEPTFSLLSRAAAFYDTPDVVKSLLQYGARLKGSSALIGAASENNVEIVRYLLEAGANPRTDYLEDEIPSPALNVAVEKGHVEVAKMLIEHGADPNVVDWNGKTAMEIAEKKQPEMIALLMKN